MVHVSDTSVSRCEKCCRRETSEYSKSEESADVRRETGAGGESCVTDCRTDEDLEIFSFVIIRASNVALLLQCRYRTDLRVDGHKVRSMAP